jgi:hypothetical protein
VKGSVVSYVVAIVFLALLIVSTSVYADGTISTTDATSDLLNEGGQPAPSQFYVGFLDIVEAHVTLSGGVYTFEMTVQSTSSDWLTSTWAPVYSDLPSQAKITAVGYRWFLRDSSGTFQGVVRATWRDDGVVHFNIRVCPPGTLPECAVSSPGVGSDLQAPPSMAFSFDQSTNSLWVTISQTDFAGVFSSNGLPTPTQWRALTFAQLRGGGVPVLDRAPDETLLSMPT